LIWFNWFDSIDLIKLIWCNFLRSWIKIPFVLVTVHNWVNVVHYFSFIKIYTRLFLSVKTNFARLGFGHISPSKNVGTTLSNFLYGVMNYLLMLCNYCFDNSGLNKIYILKVSKSQKQFMVSSILPNNEQRISGIASKERSNQKNKGTLLY
jgi:hypothetical protein